MNAHEDNSPGLRSGRASLAGELAAYLREGSLTLAQVIGLTDQEIGAIVEVAEQQRRAGRLAQATELYALLTTHDPLGASHWRGLAGLLSRSGQHAQAVACYEVLGALGGREPRDVADEVSCLEALEQPALAAELVRAHPRRSR